VLLTDTHYGPIDRTRWSTRVVDAVNALDADIVCHTGDIADGTVEQRRHGHSDWYITRSWEKWLIRHEPEDVEGQEQVDLDGDNRRSVGYIDSSRET
jgi:3',5'-cyclic AMP phosphodiesterase CpdA